MAAPVFAAKHSFTFRDAKGNTVKMRMIVGGATAAAVETSCNSLVTAMHAISNAFVTRPENPARDYTYGADSAFASVEDKARFTFRNPVGALSRYELPAPKLTIFDNDQETVDETNTDVETWIALMQSVVYSSYLDTAPLALIGGLRARRRMHRRANIFVLTPSLGEIEE